MIPKVVYDENADRMIIEHNGMQVATRGRSGGFEPNPDPKMDNMLALRFFRRMLHNHDAKFGAGHRVAEALSDINEPMPDSRKADRLSGREYTLMYCEYSNSIRIAELNTTVMQRHQDGSWFFDFDRGGEDGLLETTFLRFHQNPNMRFGTSGPEMLNILTTRRQPALDEQTPSP